MENRTLEKITTILTNLENEKQKEKAKIDEMFEEYKLKTNTSMSSYLEFEMEYTNIVKDFGRKFSIGICITPEELCNTIDYDEVCDIFGKELTEYFFSSKIKFTISTEARMYFNIENKNGCCVVQNYCNSIDVVINGWKWIETPNLSNNNHGAVTILIEYLDTLYPLFEQKMLEDINAKYSKDFNSVYDTRVSIEKKLNALKSNKNKRTDSIRNIVIQKLQESTELCEGLFDNASYTITHMSLTDYAIKRAKEMSDTDLELLYNDVMNIEED